MPPRPPDLSRSALSLLPAEAEDPELLLVTAQQDIRDDVALMAAVVGARLHVCSIWSEAPISAESWAAVLCGPDAPPPETWRGEVLLVSIEAPEAGPAYAPVRPGEVRAGHPDLWELAARHPQLRPVPMPQGEQWLTDHLASLVMDRLPGRVLAVLGAVGGAGASTVAYLTAAEAAARGLRVLLLDADPDAGSGLRALRDQARRTGTLVGAAAALDWQELDRMDGPLSAAQLTGALAEVDGISLITGEPAEDDAVPTAVSAVVVAARRAVDLVVVDAGRRVGVLDVLGGPPEAGLLVTEPSPRGVAAVGELPLQGHDVDWSVVVNGTSRGGITPKEVGRRLGLRVAAELAEQRWLRRSGELAEAYELLRSRRGAAFAGALVEAAGLVSDGERDG
ncbi:hypothetical protein [Nesterenkonia xinjiangensis]|uniref:Mrp family chromosome partitioning ATPase n=1 Tax=Nesterenkonia xinjiangensis TaxID=225327 RepID=A0A7Z0KBK7_9MICC|nr:hypothetical protein [Nesterenkonia xinjiangensis]NYJ77707.1 Mrp family chromosome partitioning ATPase [Nesterenkonia xinjiangensis]